MNLDSKIFVAGHKGLVGSSVTRLLKSRGFTNIIIRSKSQLDLRNQKAVEEFFDSERPEYVIDAAAKVGGILANSTYPAEFIYDNIMIQSNLVNSAYRFSCKKFLFLGSVCIYPKEPMLPIKEEYLMTGPLEATNEAYAIAKICGIKMCEFYRKQYGFDAISLMPTNLYGPGDNFHPQNSHVISGLIRKFHDAKIRGLSEVVCWGDGSPKREFLYSDDLAEACLLSLENYSGDEIVNVSSGIEYSIKEVANIVRQVVGFDGGIVWDETKPNGTMKRPLSISKIKRMGWSPKMGLRDGIKLTFDWYTNNHTSTESHLSHERA